RSTPPERGSFPLDLNGECKESMTAYVQCLKKQKSADQTACRDLAKLYFECRMSRCDQGRT
ncbi:hypothetical protein DFJ73DRAFT_623154, partial [Zopfochytrium polystomum]